MNVFEFSRCFTKTSGTFGSNPAAVMPIVAPYQQDSLEMKPLNHMMVAMCLASTTPGCNAEAEEDGKEKVDPPSPQDSCDQENVNPLSTDCIEDHSAHLETSDHMLSWSPLILQPLSKDCNEKTEGISNGVTLDGLGVFDSSKKVPVLQEIAEGHNVDVTRLAALFPPSPSFNQHNRNNTYALVKQLHELEAQYITATDKFFMSVISSLASDMCPR
uniref:cell adhesion molecule-related/down-regulated by oncogenes-like n=1 Tax=Podarcis muralis TaxID=64176 RepID=UPI0010A09BF9